MFFYVFGPEHRDVNEPTAMVLCSRWMTIVVERLANAGVRNLSDPSPARSRTDELLIDLLGGPFFLT